MPPPQKPNKFNAFSGFGYMPVSPKVAIQRKIIRKPHVFNVFFDAQNVIDGACQQPLLLRNTGSRLRESSPARPPPDGLRFLCWPHSKTVAICDDFAVSCPPVVRSRALKTLEVHCGQENITKTNVFMLILKKFTPQMGGSSGRR